MSVKHAINVNEVAKKSKAQAKQEIAKVIDNTTKNVKQSTVSFYAEWHYEWHYATIMRWLKRYRNGEAVCRPSGYPKQEYDPAFVEDRIKLLDHKKKRSKGTGSLIKQNLAPRRIINKMVKEARDELNKEKQDYAEHVKWSQAGTVWAIDDTLIRYDENGKRRYLTNIQDLASRYKFSYETTTNPSGQEIADKLAGLFKKHGAPLFLKRDNGSNLCSEAVDKVLTNYMVMPVNSPVRSPAYNGAIERSQAEIKAEIKEEYLYHADPKVLDLHIENICHMLNHSPRKSLRGKHACECFSQRKRHNKRRRKEIYDKVKYYTEEILEEMNKPLTKNKIITARRQAAKQVMLEENIIKITLNRKGKDLSVTQLNGQKIS